MSGKSGCRLATERESTFEEFVGLGHSVTLGTDLVTTLDYFQIALAQIAMPQTVD